MDDLTPQQDPTRRPAQPAGYHGGEAYDAPQRPQSYQGYQGYPTYQGFGQPSDPTKPMSMGSRANTTPNGASGAGADLSDEPTLTLPQAPRPSAPRGSRRLGSGGGRIPRWPRITPLSQMSPRRKYISLTLLIVLGVPILLALLGAAHDYTTIKGLGQDGVTHLLAVKSDLTGQSGSGGSSGSSSTLSRLAGGSGSSSGLLAALQTLLATPGPAVSNPAYTYLAQRQSGTFNPLTVSVRPAKGVSAEGSSTATYSTTLATNTYFALGGQPIATPTPAAATPSAATPASTATTTTSGSGHATSSIPDPARIAAAERDLRVAQSDFHSLADQLDHPDVTLALAGMLPVAGNDLRAGQALAHTGADVAQAGLALLGAAAPLLTRLHGAKSLLSGAQKLITPADITALQRAMTVAAASLTDASKRLASVDVSSLPLSARQKALFVQFAPLLPRINALLPQASSLIGVAGWLLGVDQPRHFLVQTLDRGEMRATGGFTGQYGVLTLDGGKLDPFSLQDVNCLDYLTGCLSNGWIFGRRPPQPYSSWWPFGNWGLRDSNLSADFPTDARLVTDVYYHESGQRVDGLIDVSPIAIEDVLRVTGPIEIPLYGETITADNLEAKLHYYQQDPAAIAKEKQLSAGDNSTSSRKRFTQLVGQLLQQRIKSLPLSELAPLATRMLLDMRSKDLEVYFANPQAEGLLKQLHVDGSVDTTPATDGFLLVQSNVSVSKASNFVKVTQRDNVTLDASGGATHHLTLTFSANYTYNQIYGYMTYRDYLRIYVPPQAKLLGGDGLDSGQPLCWAPYNDPTQKQPTLFAGVPTCPANPYPQGELVCPAGRYAPGPQAPNNTGSDGYTPWALDQLGGPTNTTSDIPNRAMYAGYVVVPDYCKATVTLSWYTPHVAPK
ncbi:MAG TPA: DUF4012 domain-containing protein [Ktedonobacterales bacterium]